MGCQEKRHAESSETFALHDNWFIIVLKVTRHSESPGIGGKRRWVFAVLLTLLGCGQPAPVAPPPHQKHHIQEAFHFYLVYGMRNEARAPKDGDELKQWALQHAVDEKEIFTRMGIAGREETAFTSPRDRLPYIVGRIPTEDPLFGTAIVMEQQGVDGKRFVVFETGRAEEIDSAAIEKWIEEFTNPKKKKKKP